MNKHDRHAGHKAQTDKTPFKKPNSVIIVSHPENGKLGKNGHSRKKKPSRPEHRYQTVDHGVPKPTESAHDQIMDICGWMRDDGFITNELHNDVYKPASNDDTDTLLTGIRKHMKTHDKKLMSYLRMMENIIEETDTGTSSAR